MRKNIPFFILACTITLCSRCNCNKSVTSPENQLPPATQTGANTFGCLVNGQAFLPEGSIFGGNVLSCDYQFLSQSLGGGYHFRLVATNGNGSSQTSVAIATDSLQIYQGGTINLDSANIAGKAYGQYIADIGNSSEDWIHQTEMPKYTGQLIITHLDSINQIVSGTFWFNAINESGTDTVTITDGRFDIHYTQ